MNPAFIPFSIVMGAIFLAALTLYRVSRMNTTNYTTKTTTIHTGRSMGKTRLTSQQYQTQYLNVNQDISSSTQPSKSEADLYY